MQQQRRNNLQTANVRSGPPQQQLAPITEITLDRRRRKSAEKRENHEKNKTLTRKIGKKISGLANENRGKDSKKPVVNKADIGYVKLSMIYGVFILTIISSYL